MAGKKGSGRRPKQLPDGWQQILLDSAQKGWRETEACKLLDLSYPTWIKLRDGNPEMQQIIKECKLIEHDKIGDALFELGVEKKNVTALIYLWNVRHGYDGKSASTESATDQAKTIKTTITKMKETVESA